MKVNFISRHIISSISKMIMEKQKILNHDGFYYFDKAVTNDNYIIDRVNKWNPYKKEDILPVSWYSIRPKVLVEIYFIFKFNRVYVFRKNGDKVYKVRTKS